MTQDEPRHKLADGREVEMREPTRQSDGERLLSFLSGLPPNARHSMHFDVFDRKILDARLAQVDGVNHWHLIAEHGGRIVADATMDREPWGWTRHIAEIRLVVAPGFEHQGLRHIICEKFIESARTVGVERLTASVLADSTHAIDVLHNLGFEFDVVRKSYAKDVDGKLHDVVVLSNDLEAVWRQLEQHLHDMDHYFPRLAGHV